MTDASAPRQALDQAVAEFREASTLALAQLRQAADGIGDPTARQIVEGALAVVTNACAAVAAAHVIGVTQGAQAAIDRARAIVSAPLARSHFALAHHLAFDSDLALGEALHMMTCADVAASGGVLKSETWRTLDRPVGPLRPGRGYLDA